MANGQGEIRPGLTHHREDAVVLIHRIGPTACGDPFALLVNPSIQAGEPIQPSDFTHTDGRGIVQGDPVLCDSCGRPPDEDVPFLSRARPPFAGVKEIDV